MSRSACLAFALLLLCAGGARAEEGSVGKDPKVEAKAAYERAERAAGERRFGEALAGYEEAARLDPSGPNARTARARAYDLQTHAEGNFEPLARLEAVRRDPTADRATIDALLRDAEVFPPGRVRSEARLVAGEALWHRFGDLQAAAGALDAALSDPSADKLTRALALNDLVALERERGDLAAALRAVSRFPDLAPNLYAEVTRLSRRVWLGWVSMSLLGLLAAIGVGSTIRLLLRHRGDPEAVVSSLVRPSSLAFALYTGGVASLLVRLHGDGDVRPFLWLGLGVFGVDVMARAWRESAGDERKAARVARAAYCVVSVLAVAFLSLERASAGYLESFGL